MPAFPARRFMLVLTLVVACAQHPIGELSALDHAYEGRPNEAWAVLSRQPGGATYRALHEGTFLHSVGAFERSEAVWSTTKTDGLLHSVELAAFHRLRALNRAALRQDVALLSELLESMKVSVLPVQPNEASILVIVERGWAPRPYETTAAPPLKPVMLRLDDGPVIEADGAALDDNSAWEAATIRRFAEARDAVRTVGGLLSLSRTMQQSREASEVWWSPPTSFTAAQLLTTPGVHVLLLPTPNGLRERRIELSAGQRLIVVTRS